MSPITLPSTMRAVVLKEPYKIAVEQVPVPTLLTERDVILKVHQAGLCGSDLHIYRGHDAAEFYDFILGHEVLGEIIEKGKAVTNFELGQIVLAPFSTSCGSCFYCKQGYTSRCPEGKVFGQPALPGCQAEYVRIPLADSSLFPIPSNIPPELAIIMTDILPTGLSTAWNARRLADEERSWGIEDFLTGKVERRGVCVVVGCGPVGLCAITSAKTLFTKVFATDLSELRLKAAEKHGAIALPLDQLIPALKAATDGRGADAVLEVVGNPKALIGALDLIRPYGVISSCGVHNHMIGLEGSTLYNKNVRFQFGRCSVRTFFPLALQLLQNNVELFSSFVENKISFDKAEEFYTLFEQNKVAKTVFVMDK